MPAPSKPQLTDAAGCSLMLNGNVKPMCASARSTSLVGEGHSAGKVGTGDTGDSTRSNGWASAACTAGLSRISRVLRQAANAPMPSSQARVNGEKYAATGSVVL